MKVTVLMLAFCATVAVGNAQSQSASQLQETARGFVRQGDYANAVLVLKRAAELEPGNNSVIKDLAMAYYYKADNPMALETINKIIDKDNIDDQTIQVAGLIYRQANKPKETEKMYRKALKRFPESGPLYNELGELLWEQKDYDAIKQWEKGIEVDPSYSRNYYNAARYYYFTTDKVWSLLYGEIFINMEPLGRNTPEIKQILLDSYKKLYSSSDITKNNTDKSVFANAFLKEMNKESGVASNGINTETLTMIRTRFILNWFTNADSNKFKYRLFALQQQLLRDGLFDAYNQWIFGSAQNLAAFQNWVSTHNTVYDEFLNFQKGRVFKIPTGEYYK
ncbi:MAG: tetratricopeptide repeat protein [Ferruginibacter sp.]